jgi:hypothetical protein
MCASVFVLAFASGCAALEEEEGDPELSSVEGVWDLATPPPLEEVTIDARGFDTSVGDFGPASPCSCTSIECLSDWVKENVGCGVCVSVLCTSGTTHSCSECADSTGPEMEYNAGYEIHAAN